jgi:hypothetical protein
MADTLRFVVPNLQPDLFYLNFGAWSDMHKDTGKEPFAKNVFQAAQEGICSKGAKASHISCSVSVLVRLCVFLISCPAVCLCASVLSLLCRACLFTVFPRPSPKICHVKSAQASKSDSEP